MKKVTKKEQWEFEIEKLFDETSIQIANRPMYFNVTPTFIEKKLKYLIAKLLLSKETEVRQKIKQDMGKLSSMEEVTEYFMKLI